MSINRFLFVNKYTLEIAKKNFNGDFFLKNNI